MQWKCRIGSGDRSSAVMRSTGAVAVRSVAVAAGIALAASLIGGCGGAEQEPPPVIRPVKTMVVGTGSSFTITYPGRVQSADRAELSFRVRGPVIELPIKEGEVIEKGGLIARIDPRDYQLAVDEATAAFEKAESDLQRYRRLYEQDAVPLSDLEFHQAQRDVAKARVEQAEANVDYTRLRAPFTGEVGQRYIERDENVEAGQPIASLVGTEQIEVVIDVPESMRAYFSAGPYRIEQLTASFEFAPGREFPLTLKEVASRADPSTRTYRTTLSMVQPEGLQIRSGMTATVEIVATRTYDDSQADREFVVPAVAVGTDPDGKQFVWVVNETNLTVERRNVTIGQITGTDGIVVDSGLRDGERIAIAAVSRLREGMRVRLWDQ